MLLISFDLAETYKTKNQLLESISKVQIDINIPIIGEDTEEKILIALYDAVEEVVKEVIISKI